MNYKCSEVKIRRVVDERSCESESLIVLVPGAADSTGLDVPAPVGKTLVLVTQHCHLHHHHYHYHHHHHHYQYHQNKIIFFSGKCNIGTGLSGKFVKVIPCLS